ncbi:1-aminocyclopropane-1-carboxylate oxidase homolog 4-like [Silene latifolia]|uniref:1-aminocyclopropane-1-carboxylate oxidase homolog 4-like n=1 Tax=Silene latifolia TaxID=37657 RepID=UPI003D787D04
MAANRNNHFFVGESSGRNTNLFSGESSGESDNIKWAKEFDEKQLDIKWLADNLPHVPRPFYSQSPLRTMFTEVYNDNPIPIISMQLPEVDLVEQIKQASSKFGYFQIIDHGVPLPLCDQLIEKMRSFYDMGLVFRKSWLKRSITYDRGAFYNSTHDLFNGQDPTWHDTLFLRFGPDHCDPIPEICECQVDEWTREMTRLSFWIADLFAKGLGRNDRPFSWMLGRIGFYGNFYPRCCDPDRRIVGFQPHTDPCLFSILLQDDSGGLNGLYNKNWYEIRPVRGALVIFVGDLMEILSDGVYESGIHYVKTSTCVRPRVSVLQTFAPGFQNAICTPITQSGVPLKFNPVNISVYIKEFFNSIMTIKTMVGRYKIQPPIHGRHESEPDTELCLGPSGGI